MKKLRAKVADSRLAASITAMVHHNMSAIFDFNNRVDVSRDATKID